MSNAVLFKVVFGEPLHVAMKKGDGWKIPILIHKATDYIKSKVTVASGVFTVAASKWKVQKLKEEFERGAVGLSKYNDPHSVASLLILYLTSLPEPLLPSSLQLSIHESFKTKSVDDFVQTLRSILHKSPLPNKLLLKYLFLFLHNVLTNFSTNRVDAKGLGTAWAPVFFPPPSSLPPSDTPAAANSSEDIRIMEILIENYTLIWENGDKKGKPVKNSTTTSTTAPLPHSPSHSTLLPNGDSKEVGKRSPSPVPHKRPNSGLSTATTTKTKASPIRASQISPVPPKLNPNRSTTPSKITKSPSQKRDPTPTKSRPSPSPPPRKPTPTNTRVSTPPQRTQSPARKVTPGPGKPAAKAPSPAPHAPALAPTPEPAQSPAATLPAPARATPPPLSINRHDPVAEPVPTPRVTQRSATQHETPRNLQLLADTDLNASDFRVDPHAGVIAHLMPALAAPTDDSANERSGNGESGTGGEDEGFADDEVDMKNVLVWDEEKGLVLNNRHSGSFIPIPKLNLELVMPYDFDTKPKKKSTKASKGKLQNSTSHTKPTYKKPPTSATLKPNNKTLNLPKSQNPRSPSPQPKPRPHSSQGPSRTPTRPHSSASSPSTPSLHPSSAPQRLKLHANGEEKGEEKGEEERKIEADLRARNKALEAEVLALRAKTKEDEEKLANEEKNVSFLLSRVEILDKQRMEAVNRIIDEKSHTEKELRVRISSLEADVLVLKEQLKMTDGASEVKVSTLTNQLLQSEARIALLQTQLDKAYEEIADKDARMAILEDEVIKNVQNSSVDLVVLDNYQIDTPKPPANSSPFYYHNPHPTLNGHPPRLKEQAWKETSPAPN